MSMSYVQARDTIVTYLATMLATQLPTVKVVWDNAENVDISSVGNRFIQVAVDFDDAAQATVGSDASEQVFGVIGFRVFSKVGSGTRDTLVMLDSLRDIVAFKTLSSISISTPRPGAKQEHKGWVSHDLHADFTYYQLN